jgi:hypothetical protein
MKTVIEMAKQAGDDWDSTLSTDKEFLERFAALVRADEREACAMVCMIEIGGMGDGYDCAAAIRARGNTLLSFQPLSA